MIIDKVTMTGADDSVSVHDLVELSAEFEEVEWGILVSKRQEGSPRFPSVQWLGQLFGMADQLPNLSCHFCGSWVRDLMLGGMSAFRERPLLYSIFRRWQFNFHAEKHKFYMSKLAAIIPDGTECIFQFDGVNDGILLSAKQTGINANPLFDLSGGAGIVPMEWPRHISPTCGYAGGLGPDNIEQELERISRVVGKDDHIWIDMETKIRSEDDSKFDFTKVDKVLRIVREWQDHHEKETA